MPYIRIEKPIITRPTSRAALPLGAHNEQNTDQSQQGGEILGLEEVDKEVLAFDAGEGQQPRCQGGADIGTHDDADGLSDLHDTGVHQTHQHDRHSGGGLNGDGDAGAQQQTFDGVGSHALEQPLQLAAGHFFQTFGHDRHAI